MLNNNTPVEWYPEADIFVKREDLSCDGPRFSKTRGVLAHIRNRSERVIGVLDTAHSQGGWAVARACKELGKECHLWYPWYKGQELIPQQQLEARALGAELRTLKAGRSAILYHWAKRELAELYPGGSYMMPNALKLPESVEETAAEVRRTCDLHTFENVLVSCSSGTIAAGVARGLADIGWKGRLYLHMGYSRPGNPMFKYVEKMSGVCLSGSALLIDENYAYKDKAPKGTVAPFPCNPYYDLKLWAWWVENGQYEMSGKTLMWNVG
jgi:hypothetical protein